MKFLLFLAFLNVSALSLKVLKKNIWQHRYKIGAGVAVITIAYLVRDKHQEVVKLRNANAQLGHDKNIANQLMDSKNQELVKLRTANAQLGHDKNIANQLMDEKAQLELKYENAQLELKKAKDTNAELDLQNFNLKEELSEKQFENSNSFLKQKLKESKNELSEICLQIENVLDKIVKKIEHDEETKESEIAKNLYLREFLLRMKFFGIYQDEKQLLQKTNFPIGFFRQVSGYFLSNRSSYFDQNSSSDTTDYCIDAVESCFIHIASDLEFLKNKPIWNLGVSQDEIQDGQAIIVNTKEGLEDILNYLKYSKKDGLEFKGTSVNWISKALSAPVNPIVINRDGLSKDEKRIEKIVHEFPCFFVLKQEKTEYDLA